LSRTLDADAREYGVRSAGRRSGGKGVVVFLVWVWSVGGGRLGGLVGMFCGSVVVVVFLVWVGQ